MPCLIVIVGAVPVTADGKKYGAVLSEKDARTLLPFYMDCIHSPIFKSGDLNGACDVLHKPSTKSWKQAWDVFRQMDTIQIDASRCEAFVEVIDPSQKSQAGLQPFEVKLRPASTDHDVFLQVLPTFLNGAPWQRLKCMGIRYQLSAFLGGSCSMMCTDVCCGHP